MKNIKTNILTRGKMTLYGIKNNYIIKNNLPLVLHFLTNEIEQC